MAQLLATILLERGFHGESTCVSRRQALAPSPGSCYAPLEQEKQIRFQSASLRLRDQEEPALPPWLPHWRLYGHTRGKTKARLHLREGGGKAAALMAKEGLVCSKESGPIKGSFSTCTTRWRVPADWLLTKNHSHPPLFPNKGWRPGPYSAPQHHGELPAPEPMGVQLGSLSGKEEGEKQRQRTERKRHWGTVRKRE